MDWQYHRELPSITYIHFYYKTKIRLSFFLNHVCYYQNLVLLNVFLFTRDECVITNIIYMLHSSPSTERGGLCRVVFFLGFPDDMGSYNYES